MSRKKKVLFGTLTLLGVLLFSSMTVFAAEEAAEYVPDLYATFWSLIPPLVAIGLALITKEVYSSLFIGILIGGVFYSNFQFEGTIVHVFQDGMVGSLTDSYNMGILVFLVVLGIMVCMMNKAGGSAAFGRWASEHIKSRVGAQLATILLGVLIFIDDYFNCLTVGSVMRPVTDKHNVSRAKLAYIAVPARPGGVHHPRDRLAGLLVRYPFCIGVPARNPVYFQTRACLRSGPGPGA